MSYRTIRTVLLRRLIAVATLAALPLPAVAQQPVAVGDAVRGESIADASTTAAVSVERSLSFLVIGDWGYKGQNAQRDVARRMGVVAEQIDNRFVVTTGDNFYYDGVASVDDPHWRESFEDVYTAPSLRTPWYITLGNHDYDGSIEAQLAYARRSERWTLPARYHTAVHAIDDTTSVRFLFLDTELLDSATAAVEGVERELQLAWVDSVLHASTSQWHIAVGHRPMVTGSRAGSSRRLIEDLRPLFEKHGVQVYIAGHDHDLQHLRPAGGVDYFISGAGGKPRESGANEHTLFHAGNTPGFMAVILTPSRMVARFIGADGDELYRTEIGRRDLHRTAERDGRFPPSARPDRVVATWRGDPATSLAVTWRTELGVRSAVAQVAPATPSPRFVQAARTVSAESQRLDADDGSALYHTAEFTGLEPGTLYAYRVGDGEVWSEWHQFTTAHAEARPFSFIYLGDAQNNILSLWSRTLRRAIMHAPDAAFVVHAGDLVNRASRDREWGEWFEAGGWINAMIPAIPAPGNHEHDRDEDGERRLTAHWRSQFALPEHGPAGLEETVYYIDYQGMRVISLNSSVKIAEQTAWLERVLAANPNRWTTVTFHHPVYSTARGRDNPELRDQWKPLFERYGVDLVLQGHDHTYGRGRNVGEGMSAQKDAAGPVYAVSVAGPKMYTLAEGTEWMARRAEDTQLYQVIRVDGDTLRYEARTVTGELYDAFDLVRREGEENVLIERLAEPPVERRHPTTTAVR